MAKLSKLISIIMDQSHNNNNLYIEMMIYFMIIKLDMVNVLITFKMDR